MTQPWPSRALDALTEVAELLDDYADCEIIDGRYYPNRAMQLQPIIDQLIREAAHERLGEQLSESLKEQDHAV